MMSIIIFMINEEAIAILQKIKPIPCRGDCKSTTHLLTTMALDMAIAALKAESCEDVVSRKHLLSGIDELMQSPWFNYGKDDGMIEHYGYIERKEAVEVVRDLCVKTEPSVTTKPMTVSDISDLYPSTVFKRPCINCENEDSINICDQCCFKYDSWFKKKEKPNDECSC